MAILHARTTWAKPRPQNETCRSSDLTPEESANAKAALRFLRTRLGGAKPLAAALRTNSKAIEYACGRGKPSAGLAIRAARLAGVAVEEMLVGRWPVEGACPHCGRIS